MSGRRFIIQDWDGNGVIRGSWRKAKAESRRANRLSFCAWIKPFSLPLRDGSVLFDGIYQGDVMPFHAASRIARQMVKDGEA